MGMTTRVTGSNTGQGADENGAILKMAEREDWALFRSVEGLQQKAGVPERRLRRLVMKEVADNALDASAGMTWGFVLDCEDLHFIDDNGPGLDSMSCSGISMLSLQRSVTIINIDSTRDSCSTSSAPSSGIRSARS
jgi:hypothetical protein